MSYWQTLSTLPWEPPLNFAARFAGSDMTLLFSGLQEQFTGGMSYLFLDPLETREGNDWAMLPTLATGNDCLPLWVGYLGYGMRDEAARGDASSITLPDFRLIRYGQLFCFDHTQLRITHYAAASHSIVAPKAHFATSNNARVAHIDSNFSRETYAQAVADTIEQIRGGQFYQANITRKFFGQFTQMPDSWQVFNALTTASPAPYSAYIKHVNTAILSSSPECFLTISTDGTMLTRPIKGSARRSANAEEDTEIQNALKNSTKNHAENLMIVDLMRNDLASVSLPGSVQVVEQSALYSYQTIHHLISTVRASKLPALSAYEAVRACFPAGSMTGAPKIAAMRWCTAREQIERGVYSGAIGWFGANDTCDLSVVIRTLIIEAERFEFQVGGGIVADSTPDDEWRETITKARGICRALGITEAHLEAL